MFGPFFYDKGLFYECPIETIIDLVAKITVVAVNIWEIPGVFACVSLYPEGVKPDLQLAERIFWIISLNTYIKYIFINEMFPGVPPLILGVNCLNVTVENYIKLY